LWPGHSWGGGGCCQTLTSVLWTTGYWKWGNKTKKKPGLGGYLICLITTSSTFKK
jgi:hypothetical protein